MYNRRKRGHDYYGPFIYHIILKKKKGAPEFSAIIGDPSISPGLPGCARPNYSKMGYAIFNALREFEKKYPEFIKKQYSIMPDHVHLILQKLVRTDTHLETYMEILKGLVADFYVKEGKPFLNSNEIFEPRFTDKLLYRKMDLQVWIDYVGQNPHRRAMIMKFPDFFQRISNLTLGEQTYETYGNLFLFKNPDKFAVRIRRHFSDKEKREHANEALLAAEEGSILISPFISKEEKEIRKEAELKGAKIILIQHEEFGEKYKPFKHDYELCAEGRLLIISLKMPKGTVLTHEICTQMNELAALICNSVGTSSGK